LRPRPGRRETAQVNAVEARARAALVASVAAGEAERRETVPKGRRRDPEPLVWAPDPGAIVEEVRQA